MPFSKSVKLNTGAEMPTVGLGTWKSQPGAVEHAVEFALKNGYQHIDTAAAYDNEKEVGQGIKASGVPRESIFLTTKLDNFDQATAEKALEDSLNNLGTTYLDLYLSSINTSQLDWLDTWKSMEKIYRAHPEKLKAIGTSDPCCILEGYRLTFPRSCPQQELVDFCTKKGIVLTAYSPLGSDGSPLLKNETVLEIATKYNVTPANVLVSLQANRPNVTANKTIIDLTEEDIAKLQAIDNTHHFRACHPDWTGWGSLGFPDCK
ncbi:NADP-dependent oxidoreductase domain-containing protein [Salix suchowensis]|nr:NADP-dependent oxidoreductase domain-containing protein [Salix suchowensis]